MGREGSEVSPSKRYPLRSAHTSGRVLRSASTKDNKACSEPLNDSAAAQSAVKKNRHGSSSVSPNNSVRVLRSASHNKNEAFIEPLNDRTTAKPSANKRKNASPSQVESPGNTVRVLRSALKNMDEACTKPLTNKTAGEPTANKRKNVSPSTLGSHSSSVRVLRSASNYKDETCTEPLNDSTAVEPAANRRKVASPSKAAGSPNNTVRVLRSALKNKNEACSEPPNDSTIGQPTAKRRKSDSPLKVSSPVSSARVLRSTSERKNEACDEPLNGSSAAQPAARKRKGGTLSKTDSPKICVRVLRSASGKKNEACSEPVNDSISAQTPVRRKNCRPSKDRSPKKDYVKICQRVRYILNRMNYQQSFIQAYASEGWKGQSLEKIRPEKELERAKAEILQCKLRIREAFRNMDALLSEGKLEESLFDSAGQISSEDLFLFLVPPGDEGWLCPACVCKADSIDALNELQGSKLSIHDSWEKVFPEAASLSNGSKQVDASDLPPGRIEDNDYNPELAEGHMVNEDRFSAEDDGKEDSEDDDFDPASPDSSEDQKNELNSAESDFTSDSDDFCAEIAKSCGQDEVSASPSLDLINRTDIMKIKVADNRSNEENPNRAFMDMELDKDMVLPISILIQQDKEAGKETYGKESSGSSDDKEWSGKELLEGSETDSLGERLHPVKRCSRRAPARQQNNEHTPQREQLHGSESEQQTEILCSNGSRSTGRKFGPIVTQKLKVHFEKDPYPSRATKENLAQELGLTFNQVCRWFSSTRHYSRFASAKKEKHPDNHSSENNDSTTVASMQTREPNAGVMEKLTADRNVIVPEKPMVQNNLNQCNKEDVPLSGTEIEMESYGQESSDSSDEEWSAFSTPRKARLQDNETASPAESLRPAKRCSRRTPAREQNNKHTPQSEPFHGPTSEQQTEVLRSNGSSSKASKYHFGPIVSQKLKVHFEKDPYPSRATKESLAQELGLTFNQVSKWFSATRHYSKGAAAKNKNHLGKNTTENDNRTTFDGVQAREPNVGLMEKTAADINDIISEKLMVQINLNEGIEEDISPIQYIRCEERATMIPTAISREVDAPGYGHVENFLQVSSRNTSCEQNVITTPAAISREVDLPGYVHGENQGHGAPWNTSCEQRVFMSPTTISREVGPPGYGPEENQGSGISWNMSCEQRVSSTTISREADPPGYGPGENQGNGTSWNTTCQQGMFMSPATISREVGPPGYGPGEIQGNGTSLNTSCELRMFTSPTAISREVGPPGFGPGENQGSGTSWNIRSEQRMSMSPMTISREVGPPGYGGENQGNGTSWSTSYEQGVYMSPTAISREVGPPGYGPGENQGNIPSWITSCKQRISTSPTAIGPPGYSTVEDQGTGGSRNIDLEQRVVATPAIISREVFPPGYGPGENQGSGTSGNVRSPQGRSAEKIEFSDEARKKAIQRELRRRQKFR
ncbi:Homeobox protein HOX1A [Dichanthelium oligosanthes]|uniref:Homeobox protein HOX1A n=1 Tax=Dichanthelium oligosanthes TaxID=888268 RepID=A0A1E5V1T0_9POAL|nr:Homeobox protein HOX1A [Dichanthelium oligosanthes]